MNTGVQVKLKPTDWQVGADTGIVYKEVCQDWTPYLPMYEAQERPTRTQACVSFSCTKAIQTQLKQQGININFSDRFLAKMSGTTEKGNGLQAVLDAFKKYGWLLEEDYPYPYGMTFEEYYKEIPQELKDKALKNKEDADWEVKYEWANINLCNPNLEEIKKQLKQAPLQVATSYSSGLCNFEHAMLLFHINDKINIFDSYRGGVVKFPLNYALPALMKIVVVPKTPDITTIPPLTKDLRYGDRNNEVKYLQQKLIKLGYLSKGLDTGWYYNLTVLAVKKFQKDYRVANPVILAWNGGKLVSNLTRVKLNNL